MVEFIVTVKNLNKKPKGLGTRKFAVPPRVGEHITAADENGESQIHCVKALVHPLDLSIKAGDLIVEYISSELEFLKNI